MNRNAGGDVGSARVGGGKPPKRGVDADVGPCCFFSEDFFAAPLFGMEGLENNWNLMNLHRFCQKTGKISTNCKHTGINLQKFSIKSKKPLEK
ncbi:MAG: hypothetical protein RR288_02765 [Oscillibacter sp.]